MMNEPVQSVDFETIVREARMERSLAIANAIASLVVALSRGTDWLIAKLARRTTPIGRTAQQQR